MSYEYTFNFPLPRGVKGDVEQLDAIEAALCGFRSATELYGWREEARLDAMDAKACTELLRAIAECERMLRRFPDWMVQGCFGELLASGGGDDREPLDGMFDGIARANLDALLADIEAEDARNARMEKILGLAKEGDAE